MEYFQGAAGIWSPPGARKDLPALDFSLWSFRNCCRKLPSFTNLLDTEASLSEPSSLSKDRKTGAGIWELPSPSHVGFGAGKTPGIGHFPHLPLNSQKNPKSHSRSGIYPYSPPGSCSIKIEIFLSQLHQNRDFPPSAPLPNRSHLPAANLPGFPEFQRTLRAAGASGC